jgi:hypothetical protein
VTIPDERLLRQAAEAAASYLSRLAERPVGPQMSVERLRAALGERLRDDGFDPSHVIEDLVKAAEPGRAFRRGHPRGGAVKPGAPAPAALARAPTDGWEALGWNSVRTEFPESFPQLLPK